MSVVGGDDAAVLLPRRGERLSLHPSEFATVLSASPLLRNEDDSQAELQDLVSHLSVSEPRTGAPEHQNVGTQSFTQLLSFYIREVYRHILVPWQTMKSLYGWRAGVMMGICTAVLVLLANIGLLIKGALSGYHGGVASLAQGNSVKVSNYNKVYHTLINILSTLLLGASNYAMQVLGSPTREDADAAHASGKWVEIGIVSFRNLQFMSRKRRLLWWILVISSVPLHLFYNSAVFPVISASEYNVSFIQYESQGRRDLELSANSTEARQGVAGSIQNTTTWSETHKSQYASTSGDLYLIYDQLAFFTILANTSDSLPSNTNASMTINGNASTMLESSQFWNSLNLSGFCCTNPNNLGNSRSDWIPSSDGKNPSSMHIAWAYTAKTQADTNLEISLLFILIVIVFNALKLYAMYCAFMESREEYFITVGDAIVSYLRKPEPFSKGYSTYSREELLFHLGLIKPSALEQERMEERQALHGFNGIWIASRRRYISSLSSNRGAVGVVLFIGIITGMILVLTLMSEGLTSWGSTSDTVVQFSRTSFDTTGTLVNALLANVPQLLLSISYLFFNSLCTAMATTQEWNSFATSRKGLRVSKPSGSQRSTYFLQLPYKYSIPLTVTSGLMHWLLSQSFFLVRQDYRNRDGSLQSDLSRSACGMSALSLLVLLAVFCTLFLIVIVFAFMRIQVRVPFAASCSLVYSAACHPPSDEFDAHLQPVQWGVVVQEENDERPLHCTISSQPVTAPVMGVVYN